MTHTIESRIQCNKHFASHLRRRLESRHAAGTAARKTLELLSDQELIEQYVQNNRAGIAEAKRRAEKRASE